MCASDQVNQAETMASKEQSVILKKARLTEHPLRLSPQPATKQQSAMHLKPLVSPSATSRPHPRMATCPFLSLSLAPPSTPPATLLTSFRFGPRQEDLADVPSGFWEKGLFQVCPPPPAPPPISPSSPPGAAPLLCTPAVFPSGKFGSHPRTLRRGLARVSRSGACRSGRHRVDLRADPSAPRRAQGSSGAAPSPCPTSCTVV